jgi:hypothetical protein
VRPAPCPPLPCRLCLYVSNRAFERSTAELLNRLHAGAGAAQVGLCRPYASGHTLHEVMMLKQILNESPSERLWPYLISRAKGRGCAWICRLRRQGPSQIPLLPCAGGACGGGRRHGGAGLAAGGAVRGAAHGASVTPPHVQPTPQAQCACFRGRAGPMARRLLHARSRNCMWASRAFRRALLSCAHTHCMLGKAVLARAPSAARGPAGPGGGPGGRAGTAGGRARRGGGAAAAGQPQHRARGAYGQGGTDT